MFVVNEDLSVYVTRGDIVTFPVQDIRNGKPRKFQVGEVVRFKVFEKKNCEKVVLQKDFPVEEEAEQVVIVLTARDTKIGEVISKPKDYWYEVELNPFDNNETFIGYDEGGARLFRLYPEGGDAPPYEPDPESFPIVDEKLDMTSPRPVANQVIARAFGSLKAEFGTTKTDITAIANEAINIASAAGQISAVVQARIDSLVKIGEGSTTGDAELQDIRVGEDGITRSTAGSSVRDQMAELRNEIEGIAEKSVNLFNKDSALIRKNYIVNVEGYYPLNSYSVTHPIKVQYGKVYKFPQGASLGSNNYYYRVDKDGELIRPALKADAENGYFTFTATESGYVAVNIGYTVLEETFMFCEASKYPEEYTPFGRSFKLSVDVSRLVGNVLPVGYGNKLYKKTIVWDGDSICAGKAFDDTREKDAWAGRIAAANDMTYKNYAVGGGTITENVLNDAGVSRHSVSATIEKMYSEFPNADYIILEGGTNDADLIGNQLSGTIPARFGSFSTGDFSGNYDRNTFCGALESTFYRAIQYWKGKKIGYIVAQKMGRGGNSSNSGNRRAYFETAIQICKKWGIPYLNLWDDCYLNPNLPYMYNGNITATENVNAGSFYADGQHLTAAGYDFTASIVETWLKTI